MISQSQLTQRERDIAIRMFRRLGAAEAKVHGKSIAEVHFHEVGAVDRLLISVESPLRFAVWISNDCLPADTDWDWYGAHCPRSRFDSRARHSRTA